MDRDYVFGPIHSRRLGMSSGVNLLGPRKTCTFDCVYCEVGRGPTVGLLEGDIDIPLIDLSRLEEELRPPMQDLRELDSVTFGYNGEPTLCPQLGECLAVARRIKEEIARADGGPMLSLFTNATTLSNATTRATVAQFDFVMAKLDCGLQPELLSANRPGDAVPSVEEIIGGIAALRQDMEAFPGHSLAIQTLLFKSTGSYGYSNASEENLQALASAYDFVKPNMVQVYTVARQSAEGWVLPLSRPELEAAGAVLTSLVQDRDISIRVF